MNTKPISASAHAVIDYVLVGSLLVLPSVLNLNKKVKRIYAIEAVTLLTYVACTKTPVALKPLIPFQLHGQIDPFNAATFALQTFTKPFRKQKKAVLFNVIFTALAAATILLTDWSNDNK